MDVQSRELNLPMKGQIRQSKTNLLFLFMMPFTIDRTYPLSLKETGDIRNHFSIATHIHRQMIHIRKLLKQMRHPSRLSPPMMSRFRQGQIKGKIFIAIGPLLQLVQIVDIRLTPKSPQQSHGLGTRLLKETG